MTAVEHLGGSPVPAAASGRPAVGAARRARVDAGVTELLTWLDDQLQTGLARVQNRSAERFTAMAARLIDAQAPGLAGRIRGLNGVAASGTGWNERMLAELAQLYALAIAHQRLDELPGPLAAAVAAHVGYPTSKAGVLAGPGVREAWQVIGRREEADGVLTRRRTWLQGRRTGRPALLLTFSTRGERPQDDTPPVGAHVDAELHFYPDDLRALLGARQDVPDTWPGGPPDGGAPECDGAPECGGAPERTGEPATVSVAELRRRWSAGLARDPWLGRYPAVLSMAPVLDAGAAPGDPPWLWVDADGEVLPDVRGPSIRPARAARSHAEGPDLRWVALAVGGGEPVTVSAEVSDHGMLPLAVWTPDGVVTADVVP